MKLSSANIKLEEVRKYKYVKDFIDALKKSSNYIADVYINHHLAISRVVHFIEIRNSLIACINGLVSFTKPIYANHINVKIHKSGSSDVIMQSSTRINECIEIGDQDVDLYVPVINTHPYIINNQHVPNSKFNMFGTDRVIPVDLDSQPSDDSSGGGDTWNTNWIDLGITDEHGNKILFSDRNLGANSPEDSGNFYCIGEPYYKDVFPSRGFLRIASKIKYSINGTSGMNPVEYGPIPDQCELWRESDAYSEENWTSPAKYKEVYDKNVFTFSDGKESTKVGTVDDNYDAAYVALGGEGVLPTEEQIKDLWLKTNHSLVEVHGIKCVKFESKSDSLKYIFIPLAGAKNGTLLTPDGVANPESYPNQIGCGLVAKNAFMSYSSADDARVACIIHGFFIEDSNSTEVLSRDGDLPGGEKHVFDNATIGLSVRPVKVVQSQSSDQEPQDNTINWNETGTYTSTSGESGIELNYMPAMPDSLEESANVNRMILRKSGDSLVAEMLASNDEDSDPSFTAEMPLNSLQDGNVISGTIISDMMLTKPVDKTDRKVSDYISLSGNIDVRDIESNPYIAVKVKSNGEWQLKNATCATGTYTNKAGIVITFTANEPGEEANNYRLVSEGWSAYTDGSIDRDYGIDFRYTPYRTFTLTPVSLWGGTIKLIDKRTNDLVGQDSIISYVQNGDGYEDIYAARCMALAVTNQDSLVQKDSEYGPVWDSGNAYFDMGSSGNLETSPFYGNILNYITFDVDELDLYVDDLDYGAYDDDEYHLDVTFSGGQNAHYEWVESNSNNG